MYSLTTLLTKVVLYWLRSRHSCVSGRGKAGRGSSTVRLNWVTLNPTMVLLVLYWKIFTCELDFRVWRESRPNRRLVDPREIGPSFERPETGCTYRLGVSLSLPTTPNPFPTPPADFTIPCPHCAGDLPVERKSLLQGRLSCLKFPGFLSFPGRSRHLGWVRVG